MNAPLTLTTIMFDSADPAALAAFYSTATGWPITESDDTFVYVGEGTITLAFQKVPDNRPPAWPDPAKHAHLDFKATDWANGVEAYLDRTTAYVSAAGEEERFAHPAGGDLCTSVGFSKDLWGRLPIGSSVYVDARIEFAHRRLLAAAATGDADYATAEELVKLVALAAGYTSESVIGDGVLAAAAREAILADVPQAATLCALAGLLGVSPFRLSRVFSRQTGASLTRYRNRVRVGRAMDRLADGETVLADLAHDLGFADQAHLTRTVREHVGHTPVAVRRLLLARE